MKDYQAKDIKNICALGHANSGKTSMCEAILYKSKTINRLGKIEEGTTISDFSGDEIKRRTSLSLSLLPFNYKNKQINLIDAPGQFDFEVELSQAIAASDSAIIVVSGKSGVTVGVKKAYKKAKEANKPILFFVNKLDSEHADFYKVLESLKSEFGPSICPLVAPVYKDDKVDCLVDLLRKKAYTYKNKERIETKMPDLEHRLQGLENAINEAVAESDESLFDKYFSGDKFTQEEVIKGIEMGICANTIQPVMCGSSQTLAGIEILLDGMVDFLPDAEQIQQSMECSDDFVGKVFKTVADPFYGKLSYIRVYFGELKVGDDVKILRTSTTEKVNKLIKLFGNKQEEVEKVSAGDIVMATKLNVKTNDQLYKNKPIDIKDITYPIPTYSKAITTTKDENKISSAINKLLEEDLSLSYEINEETNQQILRGMSDQHLEITLSRLKSKFGVEAHLADIKIPYRETIRKKVKAHGRHKKQTGGHGQFGEVWIEFEPSPKQDLDFEEKIFGGAVPKGYFPAVEKGLKESAKHGLLAGYPMVGFKAILVDGSYHPVDSSEMAFKMAASLAYKKGIAEASPVLLEPIYTIKIATPDRDTGDAMGELNKHRARVLGMEPHSNEAGTTIIEAEIPQAETLEFTTIVRQITQGAGSFTLEFKRYDQLPEALHSEVIAKSLKDK